MAPARRKKAGDSSDLALASALASLPEEQQLIIVLLHYEELTQKEVAEILDFPADVVQHLEQLALHAIHSWYPQVRISPRAAVELALQVQKRPAVVQSAITNIAELTPDLISHLRTHCDDLELLQPDVFEHLIGEFLKTSGFAIVRSVGRDSTTSADIFAGMAVDKLGSEYRLFVEVKRWRHRLGIEIINHVLGAMVLEEPVFGWHAAMIVSLSGFKKFQKIDPPRLEKRRVALRDRDDILQWLHGYVPNAQGLWLPKSMFREAMRE